MSSSILSVNQPDITKVYEFTPNDSIQILDSFQASKTEEVFHHSSLKDGDYIREVVIIENLKGWTKVKEIVINFPVLLVNSRLDTEPHPNYLFAFNAFLYADFGFLNFLDEFHVYIGENRQHIGRQVASHLEQIKLWLSELPEDGNLIAKLKSQLGVSHSLTQTFPGNDGLLEYFYFGVGDNNSDFMNTMVQHYINKRIVTNGVDGTYNRIINIPIPLYFLNSFFCADTMLPPNIKLEFNIKFKTKPSWYSYILSYQDYLGVQAGGIPHMTYIYNYFLPAYNDIKISYRVTNDLIYNYETYETYYNTFNQEIMNFDIAISQQKPTQIFISALTVGDRTLDQIKNDYLTNGDIAFENSLVSINSDKPYYTRAPLHIEDISVSFNGRTDIRMRNNVNIDKNCTNFFANSHEVLFKITQKEQYQSLRINSTSGPQIINVSNSFDLVNQHTCITIVPGLLIDRGQMTKDQNSIMVKLSIKYSRPPTNRAKIRITKKLHEQLSIRADNNVSINMWPVIKNNNGYMATDTLNAQ